MSTVRAALPADLGLIAGTARRAFRDDPQLRYIIDDDDRWEGPTGLGFFTIAALWFAGTGETTVTDDVAALCLWAFPERREPSAETLAEMAAISAGDAAMSPEEQARASILMDSFGAHKPAEPHVYVGVLATHPDWQRRGLGRQMMAPAFALADAEGLGCYLETGTEANVAFYRACGFEVDDEWDIVDGPHNWGLWRTPG